MNHQVDAVHDALEAKGCHHLANEITILPGAITRPSRALNQREALAMAAAWHAGYQAMGLPLCPHVYTEEPNCGCSYTAVPDMRNEQVLHYWLEQMMRPA